MRITVKVPLWKRVTRRIANVAQEVAAVVACIIGVLWIAIMVGIGMIREGKDDD